MSKAPKAAGAPQKRPSRAKPMAANPNRIQEWRTARGFTQSTLAELIDTTEAQVSRLEKGRRQLTEDWMRRLATALHVRPCDLLLSPEGLPEPGEFVEDLNELALVRWWRGLEGPQKQMVTNMMRPPAAD